MKHIVKVLILFLSMNCFAYDSVEVDTAVLDFLGQWKTGRCEKIEYEYIYALHVDTAQEVGLLGSMSPDEFKPPKLPTDVLVAVRTNYCGQHGGYILTLRENEGYRVVGYASFDQPE